MLIVGSCYSIRSERRLRQEVKMNLACRWFRGLGLEDKVPHHSTFSVNRHGRFRDSDLLRKVFGEVVCGCMVAGLVGGEGYAVDAPPIDPAAAWTTRGCHKAMFGYSLNYLIEMETAVILDAEATPTRISKEVDATETMMERVEERFGLKPGHIAGDVAYGTGEMLGWPVARDIDPHIPVWDRSAVASDGKFTRADFAYDKERDLYICPGGKKLKTSGTVHDGATTEYIAKRRDCASCPLKPQCTSGRERRVQRDVNREARDDTQSLMQTEAYAVSRGEHKKIEMLIGEAKHILSMVRLRLRGLTGARDAFLPTRPRPEPEKARQPYRKAAATVHDGLINAK